MRHRAHSLLILTLLLAAPVAHATPKLFVAPKRIVLGKVHKASFSLTNLPGHGAPHAATNVGEVLDVMPVDNGARFYLELPKRRSPQELVLLVYRDHGPILLYRVQLYGRTRLPFRTRPFSTVTFRYGKTELVKRMGGSSRRSLRLAVPPGVTEVTVEVVDNVGLKTSKTLPVHRPSYPRLALAVQPSENSVTQPAFKVVAALAEVAESKGEKIEVEALGPEEGQRALIPMTSKGEGRWEGTFEPSAEGEIRIRGTLAAEGASREVTVQARYVAPAEVKTPAATPKVATTRRAAPAEGDTGPFFELALAAGMLHNTGDFFSPQFSLAFGATYELGGAGYLGLRLGGSVAWAEQEIRDSIGDAPDLGAATSRTILAPLYLGPIYRGPRLPIIPYALAAFVVQFAHTRNTAYYTQERATLAVAPGFLAQVGGELPLDPFFIFLQGGFLYSSVSTDEVELLAGGLSLELGVRLAF